MSDDLIKRNIVIATIERMYEVCTTRDITDYRDLMLEAVKVLPSADRPQGEWIPCEERLPSKNGKYLIVGRQGAVNILPYRDGRWYGRWGVLAWMPLPKLRKGADDEC